MNKQALHLTLVLGLIALAGTAVVQAGVVWRYGYRVAPYPYRPVVVAQPVVHYTGPFGQIDFDVNPNKSTVFVDGACIGVADSFDGWPETFRVRAGKHQLKVVSPDGRVVKTTVYVQAGKPLDVDIRF